MAPQYFVSDAFDGASPAPMTVHAGTTLRVQPRESEWPGWLWCTATDGASGWVPQSWLHINIDGSATLLRDYVSRELSVAEGEVVTGTVEESGWTWATNASGESGWIPLRHLSISPVAAAVPEVP